MIIQAEFSVPVVQFSVDHGETIGDSDLHDLRIIHLRRGQWQCYQGRMIQIALDDIGDHHYH